MITLYELMDMLPDGFNPNFTDRLNELYVLLQSQEEKLSEKEAAEKFLNSTKKGKYFNKLKNELKREMVWYIVANSSVWVDPEYKVLHKNCYKSFAAYKILLLSGKRKIAIETAKTLLPELHQFELHGLIYIVATDLRFHYSNMDSSKTLTAKYETLCLQQIEILNAESLIRSFHSKLSLIYNTRESYSEDFIEEIKEVTIKILPLLNLQSNYLNRFIYNIVINRYMVEYDYENVIKYCDEALASFSSKYLNGIALKFAYLQRKLPALIAIGRLREAKEIAKEACSMMPEGNFNWHLAFIRRITVCLYSKDYQEAYNLYKAHVQEDCPYPVLKEYWRIIWGYLFFLIKVGKIEEYSDERFYLGKLLNEVPTYSKDKAGNNINLLILQIITRIYRKQYGQITEKKKALEAYARTYTRKPETKRANIFIKMILKMGKASFHRAATERDTRQLYEKLQATPLRFGQNLAIEIIPFDVLWREILNLLENKFRAKTTKKNQHSKIVNLGCDKIISFDSRSLTQNKFRGDAAATCGGALALLRGCVQLGKWYYQC